MYDTLTKNSHLGLEVDHEPLGADILAGRDLKKLELTMAVIVTTSSQMKDREETERNMIACTKP